MVTINSNKVPHSAEESKRITECFDKFMWDFFGTTNRSYIWSNANQLSRKEVKENIERLFVFLDEDNNGLEDIEKINIKYAIERGKRTRGGRIHLHAHLKVFHLSRLKMDIEELKDIAVEYLSRCNLGINSVYVNVKAFSDRARNLEIYLEKEEGYSKNKTIYEI